MDPSKVIQDSVGQKWEILPETNNQYDFSFKIIVIGDSGVGKSSLTIKGTKNIFEDKYNATIGFEFLVLNLRHDNKVVKLQIWDTCGQELYRSIITNFYRNSSIAIMVYSIDSKESFENIDIWLKELRTNSNPDVLVCLIGNKSDLEEQRQVTKEQGEKYAKDFGLNLFMEASAKTGFNAQALFIEVAKMLYDDFNKHKDKIKQKAKSIGNIKPLAPQLVEKKKGCC